LEAFVTILLLILFTGFFMRHLGRYVLRFFVKRMANRFEADFNAFGKSGGGSKASKQEQPPNPEQVIPNSVGEYVDYEEVK
jgi:hypothetical protein